VCVRMRVRVCLRVQLQRKNKLQHTATHYNALQHAATRCNSDLIQVRQL